MSATQIQLCQACLLPLLVATHASAYRSGLEVAVCATPERPFAALLGLFSNGVTSTSGPAPSPSPKCPHPRRSGHTFPTRLTKESLHYRRDPAQSNPHDHKPLLALCAAPASAVDSERSSSGAASPSAPPPPPPPSAPSLMPRPPCARRHRQRCSTMTSSRKSACVQRPSSEEGPFLEDKCRQQGCKDGERRRRRRDSRKPVCAQLIHRP